jgi:O-antigen/teichoic acid export membrane protein
LSAQIKPDNKQKMVQRLLRGFGATALGPVVTACIQLGTVPLLLHVWGASTYGDWLLLSAIPSYLTFSDLGFGDASGSDMSMRVAADDRRGAIETFQSSWVLVSAVSLAALAMASVFAWFVPWQAWLHLSGVSNAEAAKIVLVLGMYVAISQQYGVLESGYRCDGHFATGTFLILLQRVAETLVAMVTAIAGGGLLAVAFAYLATRTVGTIGYAFWLHRLSPWIDLGIRHARKERARELAAPAIGFMAFPLGYALSLQGFTVVIGAVLGPVAVVSFTTLRTMSRVSLQLMTAVKHAMWPEFSRVFGEGNIGLARKLHRLAWRASVGMSLLGGAFLWLAGPYIYRFWLHQEVAFNAACFHLLLMVVVANTLWDTSAVVPMSVNGHCGIALVYSGAALASLILAWTLLPRWSTPGAGFALLVMDGFMTVYVLRTALRHTGDSLREFVEALFSIPLFRRALPIAPEAYGTPQK